MKRIYITAVPLQSNFVVEQKPVNPVNFALCRGPQQACFPIVPIIAQTVRPGDSVHVLAVCQKNQPQNENLEILKSELDSLQLPHYTLQELAVAENQGKDTLLGMFSDLLGQMEDDACYYACMTFGTKTFPLVLFSVLSCVEKIKKNVEIQGIYYQEITRSAGVCTAANLYDVTALFTLNRIVDLVAEMDADHKEEMVRLFLEQ